MSESLTLLRTGDRVILTPKFNNADASKHNPVWGSSVGYILGVIKKVSLDPTLQQFVAWVQWENEQMWTMYPFSVLRKATPHDEELAAQDFLGQEDKRTFIFLTRSKYTGFFMGACGYTDFVGGQKNKRYTFVYTTRALDFDMLDPSPILGQPDIKIFEGMLKIEHGLHGYDIDSPYSAFLRFCKIHELPTPTALPDPLMEAPCVKWALTGWPVHSEISLAAFTIPEPSMSRKETNVLDWLFSFATEDEKDYPDSKIKCQTLCTRLSRANAAS